MQQCPGALFFTRTEDVNNAHFCAVQLQVYKGELTEKLKDLLSHGLLITINSGIAIKHTPLVCTYYMSFFFLVMETKGEIVTLQPYIWP